MTNFREILRLNSLGLSNADVAEAASCSRNTVSKVLKACSEKNITWPLPNEINDSDLQALLFSAELPQPKRKMPDLGYIHKELQRMGVTRKLLWTEYLEECRICNERPLMFTQFCHYIQQDEQMRHATMHFNHKPGERMEVDWAGDKINIVDSETGKTSKAHLFVGVLPYSQYSYVEAFPDEKELSWINAHVHMFSFFGGVPLKIIPDNCKTAVIRASKEKIINKSYREMAEYYGTAIFPARPYHPKDKSSAEGCVGNITTYIIAALRNNTFFSIDDLNTAIRQKMERYNNESFQKKDGSRASLFNEEKTHLRPLPKTGAFKLSIWKVGKVQYDYHVYVEKMYYSVPYSFIKKEVSIRISDTTVEIFFDNQRIATHKRLSGSAGQHSTMKEHMPPNHRIYADWDGEKFLQWAEENVGSNAKTVMESILKSREKEQQSYRSCMYFTKLVEKHSPELLEAVCARVLSYTPTPSLKTIKSVLSLMKEIQLPTVPEAKGITRGPEYYRKKKYTKTVVQKTVQIAQ